MPTTVRDIRTKAGRDPITVLTAYDAPTAAIIDAVGVDAILVGDSMGNTALGYESTLPVTLEEMMSRTAAVARATEDAVVIADMPFLSLGMSRAQSVENCGRMLKDARADAVKIESGPHTVDLTEHLTNLGIPVMGHVGLTPQRVKQLGYLRQGTNRDAAREILDLARAHEDAGAFSMVVEHVPANLAAQVTEALEIPTIGIGAGPDCDGQVLVIDDVIGMSERTPPFSKSFGNVRAELQSAVEAYCEAVISGEFPGPEHSHVEDDLNDLY